jgi:hypothetical protein
MLPGLRLVIAAITATMLLVVLALAQLVKLQEAQSRAASLPPPEARFAGLAFAERADWAPETVGKMVSLETLPPFSRGPSTFQPPAPTAEPLAETRETAALAVPLPSGPAIESAATEQPAADDMSSEPQAPAAQPTPALASAEDQTPAQLAAGAAPAMLELPPDPPELVALAIDPAPLDLTPSPPPIVTTALPDKATVEPLAFAPTAAADDMPAIVARESEPIVVAPSISERETAKLQRSTPAIFAAEVKIPTPRPHTARIASAHRDAKTRPARPKQAHARVKPTSIRPKRIARKPVRPPVAAQPAPTRPRPINPFTALFGTPRQQAVPRN